MLTKREFDGVDKNKRKAETRFEELKALAIWTISYRTWISPESSVKWMIFAKVLKNTGKSNQCCHQWSEKGKVGQE